MSLISNNQLFYKDGKHNEDPGNEDYCEFDGDVDVDEFGDGDDNDNGDDDLYILLYNQSKFYPATHQRVFVLSKES